jgi:hypothetical protein
VEATEIVHTVAPDTAIRVILIRRHAAVAPVLEVYTGK